MPVRTSKRGARASPLSTTTRTPSTVSDVSAMSVVRTTRRRPVGDGGERGVLLGERRARRRAGRGRRRSPTTSRNDDSVRLISPTPGRNARTSPDSSTRARCTTLTIAGSSRVSRLRGTQRTSTSNCRPVLAITGAPPSTAASRSVSGVADIASTRRSGRRLAATSSVSARPRSVGRLRSCTSSNTIEPDPGQRRVVLQPSSEDALRDDLQACSTSDPTLVACLVADGLADLLAEQVGHPPRRRTCGQPARFEHHDPSGRPTSPRRAVRAARWWSCRLQVVRRGPRGRPPRVPRGSPEGCRRPGGRRARPRSAVCR